jgi:cobalt-zinc-cadmium efflux system protein
VALVGLIGNLSSIWLLHSEKGKSLNMKTAFLHMVYDALSSVAVVIGGMVIMLTGWYVLDVILSTLIGIMILYSSYLVIKEAVIIFLEAVPEGIKFDEVLQAISAMARVKDVHDLHIWSLSSNEIALSCHVSVEKEDYSHGPALIVQINAMLNEKFKIGHGTIQLEIDDCHRTDVLCGPGDQHHQKFHGQNS